MSYLEVNGQEEEEVRGHQPVHPVGQVLELHLPVGVAASLPRGEPQLGRGGGGVECGGYGNLRRSVYCLIFNILHFFVVRSVYFLSTLSISAVLSSMKEKETPPAGLYLSLEARTDVDLVDLHERLVQVMLHCHFEALARLELKDRRRSEIIRKNYFPQ